MLTRGVFTVLEAAVLYQNRKGKATTFLFRFFFLRYVGLKLLYAFLYSEIIMEDTFYQ